MTEPKKIVLAYSGGLDTSVIIPWLKENHGYEVHCLAGDVGQRPNPPHHHASTDLAHEIDGQSGEDVDANI